MKLSKMSLSKNRPLLLFVVIVGLVLFVVIGPNKVQAAELACPLSYTVSPEYDPSIFNLTFDVSGKKVLDILKSYSLGGRFEYDFVSGGFDCKVPGLTPSELDQVNNYSFEVTAISPQCFFIFKPGSHRLRWLYKYSGSEVEICSEEYEIDPPVFHCSTSAYAQQDWTPDDDTWKIKVSDIKSDNAKSYDYYQIKINIDGKVFQEYELQASYFFSSDKEYDLPSGDFRKAGQSHKIDVFFRKTLNNSTWSTDYRLACKGEYNVNFRGEPTPFPTRTQNEWDKTCRSLINNEGLLLDEVCTVTNIDCLNNYEPCEPYRKSSNQPVLDSKQLCEQLGSVNSLSYRRCNACLSGGSYKNEKNETVTYGDPGSWTALGCIPTDTAGFVKWLLGPFMGIAGGIAFLLILKGGYQIMFSQGNPETITDGRDTIVAAVSGLVVIILSVAILEIIGVEILNIPGFGR